MKKVKFISCLTCVCTFDYFFSETEDGKAVLSKEVLITIDDKNHSVTLKMIEGLLMESYKSFKFIVQATPMDEGSLVH